MNGNVSKEIFYIEWCLYAGLEFRICVNSWVDLLLYLFGINGTIILLRIFYTWNMGVGICEIIGLIVLPCLWGFILPYMYSSLCYIIAEGFRFVPLSLGWEPFGAAHGLVGCNIEAGVNAGAHGRMEVSLRCHNTPRQNGWRGAGDVTHRKRAEVCVRIWRKSELGTRRQTRRIDFWSSQSRGERAPNEGRTRWGAKWIRQHRSLSSLRRDL